MTESTTQAPSVPAGYWKDPRGNLVPESTIKPIDRARDDLVKELVGKAREVSTVLAQFKGQAFADIAAFVSLSAEQYGVPLGGKKGNVTLMSFDGRYRVVRAMQEHITFDERLQAAKALIDQCLAEWTQGARPELKVIINRAFEVDKEGNINTGAVLGLRRLNIDDSRWTRAMAAIGDAVQVVGSKSYVRVYERVGESDQYVPIALDVAGV